MVVENISINLIKKVASSYNLYPDSIEWMNYHMTAICLPFIVCADMTHPAVYVFAVSHLSAAVFPSPVYSSHCSPCPVSYPMPLQDPRFSITMSYVYIYVKLVLARCLNTELVRIPCHTCTCSIRLLSCLTMMCTYHLQMKQWTFLS